jgi:hypothetical protein
MPQHLQAGSNPTPDPSEQIPAEVVLRPGDNESAPSPSFATAENIHQFAPKPGALERTVSSLRDLGFRIVTTGPMTISIEGPRPLFDKIFHGSSHNQALRVPDELADQVKGIYVQPPPVRFA